MGSSVDARAGSSFSLRQAEVEDLDDPIGAEEHVLGLQVAVDDAARVRGGETARDLLGHIERLARRPGDPRSQCLAQRRAGQEFGGNERHAVTRAGVIDGDNVRMV